ncbi:uncharacterized protein LOC115450519 isoform X2 [Manduca sexta]|uniref:uncharacterized protein LOC115450519 isoform X2 n=1 Tax=Manduca sexta TaxID=7130 RepID=UPI001182FAAE|nr:uncharacterized protein LOC115450519 isoform X2 [Manduca sexta]
MEWFTTECGKYRIESLSAATVPGALNVIRVAFFPDEFVCQSTEIASSTEKPFFEIFAEERCTQASSRAVVQFMADIDSRINMFEKYQEDCSLEIMFLATLREYRKHKLGTMLCKYSIELAKKLKDGPVSKITVEDLGAEYSKMQSRAVTTKYPKLCQALGTGIGTQKITNYLGFTVHLRVSYAEFVYDGKTYLERMGYDPHCEAVALKLY